MRQLLIALFAALAVPAQAATVQGQVLDQATLQPIADASIALVAPGFLGIPMIVAEATSGSDGRYSVSTSAAMSVAAVASAPGFSARSHVGERCASPESCLGVATPLLLDPQVPATANFSLTPAARISGRLRGVDNQAPASAYVQVRHVGNPALAHLKAIAETDEQGNYQIEGLHGGSYVLQANGLVSIDGDATFLSLLWPDISCDNLQRLCDDGAATPVSVADGAAATGIDATLHQGGYVRVRMISDGNGLGVPHRAALSAAADPSRQLIGSNGGEGYAVIGPLLPGQFKLSVHPFLPAAYPAMVYPDLPCNGDPCDLSTAPLITLSGAATLTLNDVHVLPLRSIRGKVTDAASGAPLAGVSVATGIMQFPAIGLWGFSPVASAVTNASGEYILEGFSGDGSNLLVMTRAAASGWIDRAWQGIECNSSNRFCNEPGMAFTELDFATQPHPAQVDFALSRGASLAGRVVFDGSGEPAAGYSVATVAAGTGLSDKPVQTDSNGEFRISGLPAASYYLYASVYPAFANTEGTLYPDLPCLLSYITLPLDCGPGSSQQLTPPPGGELTGLVITVGRADALFADTFELF